MNAKGIGGLALLLALAACGQSVTAPDVAPRFDGGHTLGGGFAVETPTAGIDTEETTCEEGDRGGGHALGGGFNVDRPCPEPTDP